MAIEAVDIGGAAKEGRPKVVAPTTVEYDAGGNQIVTARPAETKQEEIPDRVARAVQPGAKVAYPKNHPANNEDMAMSASGALMPEKGQLLTQEPKHLGDVKKGFVSDQDNVVKPEQSAAILKQMENEEEEEVLQQAPTVATDISNVPLIEVIFHLEQGAIVGYYNKVEAQGRWLILVVDNTQPAKQRFVPKPAKDANGDPIRMDIVITGSDRVETELKVISIGMQFTLDTYDLTVLLIGEEPDGDGEA